MRILAIIATTFLCFSTFANIPPALNLTQTVINPFLCSSYSEAALFQPLEIVDADNDVITILGMTSSDQGVIQDVSLSMGNTSATGVLSSYL